MKNLKWRCHICGEMRPDEFISVYSKEINLHTRHNPQGVMVKQNVRYCNDKWKCTAAAPRHSFISKRKMPVSKRKAVWEQGVGVVEPGKVPVPEQKSVFESLDEKPYRGPSRGGHGYGALKRLLRRLKK